jgi:hypothetical protein
MMLLIRMLCLASLVVVLAQCSGGSASSGSSGARGCSQIPEKSTGPCRVGLSPKSYSDSSWKSQ